MSYVAQPEDYWKKSIGPYGTPGWQFAPVPGWGINAEYSAAPRRIALGVAASSINLNSLLGAQQALNLLGFGPLAEDGTPGPKTTAALTTFQKANGLISDGTYGPQTQSKLRELLAKQAAPVPSPVIPTPVTPTPVTPASVTPTPVTPAASTGTSMTTYYIVGGIVVVAAAAILFLRKK